MLSHMMVTAICAYLYDGMGMEENGTVQRRRKWVKNCESDLISVMLKGEVNTK